jgi:signal transduction histidine kinase/CheY-like chemotaxis protein
MVGQTGNPRQRRWGWWQGGDLPPEWTDLGHERFLLLLGLLILSGALLLLADRQVAPLLQPQALLGKPVPVLALSLVAVAALAHQVGAHLNPNGGLWLVVLGTSAVVWLALAASLGPALNLLTLIPAVMAVLLLPAWPSLLVCLLWSTLCLAVDWPGFTALNNGRGVLVWSIAMLWSVHQIVQSRQTEVLQSYYTYMQDAQSEIEAARDDRLRVNQLNSDLAAAYGQLSRLYKLLQASRLESELARQTKEQFVANVSHELRAPLNMIIGFSEMMMENPQAYGEKLPGALLSDIHVIYRNSQHLSELINDVLVLSQAEAGQLTLNRTWCDAGELVAEAVQAVEPLFKSKNLPLITEIEPALPPVFCDRLRIRQVLLNLLSNAGRYTQQGQVVVSVRKVGRNLIFAVRDTGPGIAPEDQQRIFEPFQQAGEPTRRRNEGSGLGLSISRQFIAMHDGKMELESTLGVGTTFFFSLPDPSHDDDDADAFQVTRWLNPYLPYDQTPRRPLPALPPVKERILVLEKSQVLSPQLSLLLPDVEILPVADVQALADATAAIPPALVVINDAGAMNEKNFSRRLLNLPERMPILSCYLPARAEALADLQVVDYLVKPVTRQTLLATLAPATPPNSIILLVEDQAETARLVRRQLQSAGRGYRVLHAADSRTALHLMRTRQPQLVLLDLSLADRDGYELLQEKNEDAAIQPIPVIILSARDPVGGPIVTGRLRVERVGGLSVRDLAQCINALMQALSPGKRSRSEAPPEIATG